MNTQVDLSPLDRHDKIALSFSGGKDSLACVYLLKAQLDRITLYHLDTGDLLPEITAVVDHVRGFAPHFVTLQGDIEGFVRAHGLPTDLMPHSAHPVGRAMAEHPQPLISRYDCCFANLMWPLYLRMRADDNTLIIRGTKAVDMRRMPVRSGDAVDGVEFYHPLQSWTHGEVLDYLREAEAPIARLYEHMTNAPECARCSAWWSEGRGDYLRRFYPGIHDEYQARLRVVIDAIEGPLAHLRREINT